MKTRVFISSTFYDLKYIREDISNFVMAHDFEPILFETGDIDYTPGKPLDESCYESMKTADIAILIIEGSYGSPATGEKIDEFKEYLSVTRREFTTAVNEGIPIYPFVESAVLAEYNLYDKNIKKIEENHIDFEFNVVKDINVFRFIKEIFSHGIVVTKFSNSSEIKEFLGKQWSGMFKNYLSELRKGSREAKMVDTVGELKTLVKQMNVMLDMVGSKVLTNNDGNDYKDVIQLQQVISAADKIAKSICIHKWNITDTYEIRNRNIKNLLSAIRDATQNDIWKYLSEFDLDNTTNFFDFFLERNINLNSIKHDFVLNFEELNPVFNNKKALDLLRDELIKDDNYRQLCNAFVRIEIDGGYEG